MLVLSRQRDETIMIGDQIQITVVDIRGNRVRLGIRAPQDVQVHRQEVYQAIRDENARASQLDPEDLRQIHRSLPSMAAGKGRRRRKSG